MNWEEKVNNFLKDDNKKTIFLVNAKTGLETLAVFFNGLSKSVSSPYVVVFWGAKPPEQFIRVNLTVRASETYLTKGDYERIDEYVFGGITKSWYLYKDITAYNGIHLGRIFEYDFQKYLTPRIKSLEIIRKAVASEKAGRIIAIEDGNELCEMTELFAVLVKMPLLTVSLKQRDGSALNFSKFQAAARRLLRRILDGFSYRQLMRGSNGKGFILSDAKLYGYFRKEKLSFIVCPLESGVGTRLELIRKRVPYLPLYFEGRKERLKDWGSYQKKWKNLSEDENFRKIFEYEGISIWEAVKPKIALFFREDAPRMVSNINVVNDVAKTKQVKIAVLRNDVRELERTVILSLRLRKIPSMVIQHGILAESNGHNFLLADKFAAWGKASVEWYAKFDNPTARFEVTGNPRFDMFINWVPRLSKRELCERLNLDENKGIVLFVTQQVNKFSSFWTDDTFWAITDKLLETMRQFPDKQLLIKADPYERLAPYTERISVGSYINAVAVRDIDIYTLIYFSELVITQDSTAGLEAMILDKPLITVNLTKREDRVPYSGKGAALGVYEEVDLPSAIEKALTDQEINLKLKISRSAFLEEYAYKIDGKANERISSLLKYYIEN